MLERFAATSPALIMDRETPPMDAQESLETLMTLYQEGDLAAAMMPIRQGENFPGISKTIAISFMGV